MKWKAHFDLSFSIVMRISHSIFTFLPPSLLHQIGVRILFLFSSIAMRILFLSFSIFCLPLSFFANFNLEFAMQILFLHFQARPYLWYLSAISISLFLIQFDVAAYWSNQISLTNSLLREHLENPNSILLDLYNLDVNIEDEYVALILLVSLPSSFKNFVESFVVGKDSLTLEEVKVVLYTRELRQNATGDNRDCGSWLMVRSGKNFRRKKRYNNVKGTGSSTSNSTDGSSNTWNITYWNYKEPEHIRSDCLELKNKSQATIVERNRIRAMIQRKT